MKYEDWHYGEDPVEDLDFEKVLQFLDQKFKDAGDDVMINRPLGYLREILIKGEAYRKELVGVRSAGAPEFNLGEVVTDLYNPERRFAITNREVMYDKDLDTYQWFYRCGPYYIPETDLKRF